MPRVWLSQILFLVGPFPFISNHPLPILPVKMSHLPLFILGTIELRHTRLGGVDIYRSIIGLSLQVDVQHAFVSSVSENLCTIEGHDMVCNGFHSFQSKVVVVNTKIANLQRGNC